MTLTATGAAPPFVDFKDVWLASNDELLQAKQFAVEAIDLKITRGEFLAIAGPSGCGQVNLHEARHGAEDAVDRPHPHQRPARDRAAKGFRYGVPGAFAAAVAQHARQRAAAAGDRRAVSLQLPRQAGRARRPRAPRLLQKVGLSGYEDKFSWQLSGGMQQRAGICRALIHEPKMLLLDEPSGALDAFTREELWCILRDLWTEQRFNGIFVTHDLRESVSLTGTVYVMSKSSGRFVVEREMELPRPREFEATCTKAFADLVHQLREHIGAIRSTRQAPAAAGKTLQAPPHPPWPSTSSDRLNAGRPGCC